MDNKGRNFLHVAVQSSDIESVLFLISVQANVNSRVQDASKLTPLHLAVQAGSEIIVRNLVSATAALLPVKCGLRVLQRVRGRSHPTQVFCRGLSEASGDLGSEAGCWGKPVCSGQRVLRAQGRRGQADAG